MTADRDVSDVVLASFTSVLRRERVRNPAAVAREQIGIARAHGVRFAVPAHWHDPNADHRNVPEPGDHEAGVAAALAAIGKGICKACGNRVYLCDLLDGTQVIGEHDISDNPPHPPFHACAGAGKPPRTALADATDQIPDDEEKA